MFLLYYLRALPGKSQQVLMDMANVGAVKGCMRVAVVDGDIDYSFYAAPFGLTNGPNTCTAIAQDASGDLSTNTSTVNVILTNSLYTYDLNGNMTSDGDKNFAYDDENELIGVWVNNAWSNSFAYDGKMRRRIERDYNKTAAEIIHGGIP